MCCSRVESVRTKPRLPLRSVVSSDEAAGDLADELFAGGDDAGVGAAVAERDAEGLGFQETISASAGGRTMPSETASAMETTSSAPLAWTRSAMAATSSMVPKKLGDWMSTQAVLIGDGGVEGGEIDAAIVGEADFGERQALVAGRRWR